MRNDTLRKIVESLRNLSAIFSSLSARASLLWVAERGWQLLAALLSQVLFMQSLGRVTFGELGYVLAVVALLLPFCHFGLAGLVSAALLRERAAERDIFASALFCRTVGWALSIVVCIIYLLVLPHDGPTISLILFLSVAQYASVYQVLEYRHQIDLDPSGIVRLRSLITGTFLLAKLIAVVSGAGLWTIVLILGLELIANGFIQLASYRRCSGWLARADTSGTYVGWFLKRAPILLMSSLLAILYLKLDIVMLQRLSTPDEVGAYVAAVRLSEAWYAIPPLIVASLFPGLWALRSDFRKWRDRSQLVLDGLVALSVVAILGVMMAGHLIFNLFLQNQFHSSMNILLLHGWAGIFIAVRAFASQWLASEEYLIESVMSHGIGALVNVSLNFLWIPNHGAIGAAYATLAAYAISCWLSFLVFPRTRALGLQISKALVLPMRPGSLINAVRATFSTGR